MFLPVFVLIRIRFQKRCSPCLISAGSFSGARLKSDAIYLFLAGCFQPGAVRSESVLSRADL